MNAPLAYPDYNWLQQACSDLSADGAPSLKLWDSISAFHKAFSLLTMVIATIVASFLCLTACNKQASDLLPWVETISFVEDSELPCEIIYSYSNDTVTPNFLDFNSEYYSTSKEDFEKVLSYLNSLSFEKTKDHIATGSANNCVEIAIPSSNNGIKEYERYYFGFSDGITHYNEIEYQ